MNVTLKIKKMKRKQTSSFGLLLWHTNLFTLFREDIIYF